MRHDSNTNISYIRLAAAIVNSGIAERDEYFLKSEWCQELIEAVVDFSNTDPSSSIKNIYLPNREAL